MGSINVQINQRGVITIPKSLRESYGIRTGDILSITDLGGVFMVVPRQSEVDTIANMIASQWIENGETLETMLQALQEERAQQG